MRISEGVEWAAHCATVLAGLPEGATLSAATLAEFHGVPKPYLAKALQGLSRAGLVATTAGRTGGYRLARAADQITLLDVVQAVEGREPAFRCTEIRRRAPHAPSGHGVAAACHVAAAMWRAEDAWRESLSAVTIADIARGVDQTVPRGSLQANGAWLAARAGRCVAQSGLPSGQERARLAAD